MTQPELTFEPPPARNLDRLEQAFADFHAKNPSVYRKFCEHCESLIAAGFKRYSADGICHAIRYAHDVSIQSVGDVDAQGHALKLNNNHVRLLAEKWTAEHPQYPDFFQSRKNQHG